MINVHSLTDENIGDWVGYLDSDGNIVEVGRIKGWNELFVFVVYKCDDWNKFQDYTAIASNPKHLKFLDVNHLKIQEVLK